ncbi:hypothetical protein MnTg01_00664 [archaeon MnTg01]|nr:hypothetical protein MnTg01_00664 [archaeon MnTg01]
MEIMMPLFPTIANIITPIATTIPILTYFPTSGAVDPSSFGLLYKVRFVVRVVN